MCFTLYVFQKISQSFAENTCNRVIFDNRAPSYNHQQFYQTDKHTLKIDFYEKFKYENYIVSLDHLCKQDYFK